MELSEADIQPQLTRRRPGQSKLTTPRDEKDTVTIMSGCERGVTLGTPIALFVPNENVRPGDYKEMAKVPRPGHADYTYQCKYGTRASSGGGRSSARETIGRVAAGAIAEKWLRQQFKTEVTAFVSAIGSVEMPEESACHPSGRVWTRQEIDDQGKLVILRNPITGWKKCEDAAEQKQVDAKYEDHFLDEKTDAAEPAYMDINMVVYDRKGNVVDSPANVKDWNSGDLLHVRCPHTPSACEMSSVVRTVKADSDSIGGVVRGVCSNMPIGLGEPCFDKLPALMAHAMMSLPATKGFEFGSGFGGTVLRGSQHNDMFEAHGEETQFLRTKTNHAGGTLGGISNGHDFTYKVAIKPVSTIGRLQETATFDGKQSSLEAKGRHDPCVLPRTPPLLEAMAALVLADLALIQMTRADTTPPLCSFASEKQKEGGSSKKRARVAE